MTPSAAHIRYQSKLFIGSSHSWALEKLEKFPITSNILDIGPGSGVIGSALRERGYDNLSAVEIDPDAREHVKPIYNIVTDNLDALGDARYDIILLLDVIEHVAEPEQFLRKVAERLTPNGTILVSVPNIAHWSVRFQLLFGFFCYTNRGLLDRTHLQFFTRTRVRDFPKQVPRTIAQEFNSSIPPLELLVSESVSKSKVFEAVSRLRLAGARIWPGMFAYQHLCVLQRQ